MAEPRTYTGGCHCGAVRFRATTALGQAASCNCSICQKTGTLLVFVPGESFQLLSGEDVLADYQFGKRRIHHLFCSRCGVRSFARGAMPDGSPVAAVNVRCLDDVDLAAVAVKPFDGRSLPLE